MGFTSKIPAGIPIHNDTSHGDLEAPPPGQGRGRIGTSGYAAAGVASSFPPELLIPRSEWQARIQEMEERKTRLSDIIDRAGLPVKNQASTNYCWINAPVHCMEINRVQQNQEMVIFSPASCGGPIKNFRNDGGWGLEGLQYIVKNGVVPVDKWPANAIDRKYWTPENKTLALKYRVLEWVECKPRNIDEHISLLLRRVAVAVGLNYWGHEVSDIVPLWLDGAIAVMFNNSWGPGWGANGRGVRQGSKMPADDACSPFNATAA